MSSDLSLSNHLFFPYKYGKITQQASEAFSEIVVKDVVLTDRCSPAILHTDSNNELLHSRKELMMNYTINGNEITVTGHFLKVMEQNELKFYHTLGSENIYAANSPQWQDDECVATPDMILCENGYTDSEDLEDDEELVFVADLV